MAVRGINPFEKHIEKIFLALAAAGLTGVVAWQVGGGAGTVEVNREQVPIDQAYGKIESKAKQLTAQMREADPKTPEKLAGTTDLLSEYQKRLQGPVSPKSVGPWSPPGLPANLAGANASGTKDPSGQFFMPPTLPMAAKPIAHPFMSTINDEDVKTIENLAKYVPSAAPFDKAAVSVETTVDPKAIRAALELDPDGAGPAQPLLRAWWAGTEIVAVELVREELKPDGTFGNEVATPVLPGRKSFVAELNEPALDSQHLAQIAFDASASMEELLKPQWYGRAVLAGNVVGDAWQPPSEIDKNVNSGGNQPLDKLNKQRAGVAQNLAQAEKALANAEKAPAPKPPGGGGGGGGGMRGPKGAGGGGGGGGAPGGGGGAPAPKADPREQQIKDLQKRIETLKKQLADLDAQIAGLGGKVDGAAPKPVVRDNDLSVLLSSTEPVTVWHHDVDAVRGATYRYQLRIKVNNPLFNRSSQLKDEHKGVGKSPTLTIPSGGWTDPVHVDDEVYSFFTAANPPAAGVNGGTGLGSAQATLFYFTWGYWRSTAISLEPGDGMVARWKVPDESKINAAPAGGAPQPLPPGPAGGGGKGRPAGVGGAPAPLGGGGNAPAPAATGNAPLPTKDITKERDAFLLDVVLNPLSKSAKNYFALIRDVDKSIVAKDPDEQKLSDVFRRLTASAAAGLQQLQGLGSPAGNAPAPVAPAPPPFNPRGGGGLGGG